MVGVERRDSRVKPGGIGGVERADSSMLRVWWWKEGRLGRPSRFTVRVC